MNKVAIFIDVDNTLLDNDYIKNEIKALLITVLGEKEAKHFWDHHDQFRDEKNLVDFPNIIRAYCEENHKDTCELTLGNIFNNIDFKHVFYPKSEEVIKHLRSQGRVIIFSEGDRVYQKNKIENSGLLELVDEVLLYEHKLEHLDEIMEKYSDYVIYFIEDKAGILEKIKNKYSKAITIEILQGHWANQDHKDHSNLDFSFNSIGELLQFKV